MTAAAAPIHRPAIPTWFIATIVASAAGIVLGLLWDISWHMTVGRDTFWTPPHVLEYLAAICAGISCGYVVLRTTFGGADDSATVRFWGFRGPLGAWITIWGTFAMLASAPFDDWWHNAYGLDVKIVSPPHMVLFWGMLGIVVGALVLTASAQNRSNGTRHRARRMALRVRRRRRRVRVCVRHHRIFVAQRAALGGVLSRMGRPVSALVRDLFTIGTARNIRRPRPRSCAC